jgi:hypothetical protein
VGGWRRLVVALAVLVAGGACGSDSADDGADVTGGLPAEPAGSLALDTAGAALGELAAAMEAGDVDRVVGLTDGPAQTFFRYQRHFWLADGADGPPFPNVNLAPGAAEVLAEDRVRFAGPLGYGTQEGAPPRLLTDLEFVDVASDGGWRLERFVRNGHPIGGWVSPADDGARVEAGPLVVEVVGLFSDVPCNTGTDPGCPAWSRDKVAVAFLVTNRSETPVDPAPMELPDGTLEPAWLETSDGDARPLVEVVASGLAVGAASPVVALFPAADDLTEGGALHLAFVTAAGERLEVSLPVPPYPYPWDGEVS